MTTLIQGGWIIGSDGSEHGLVADGVLVFEKDRILHVGKSYSGRVEERIDARGKIVSPGLINMHCHMGNPINNSAYTIDLDAKTSFQNIGIPYAPTKGKMGRGGLSAEAFEAVSTFSLCSLLKSGCTTILEMGAGRESLVRLVGELGLRAYTGPGFRSAESYTGDDGTFYEKDWSEERGLKGLERAKEFVEKYGGAHGGRVKGFLIPAQVDHCTPTLLREVRRTADELKVGIGIHAGQRVLEFHEIVRMHRHTPVGFLGDVGLLGPDLVIGHGLYVSGHPWTAYPGDADLRALARTGTTVAHCPLVIARSGQYLDSFGKYQRAGVNMALGTDTWPMDLISEMRLASLLSKTLDRDRSSASSLDVFNAVTLNAARALRNGDIGKLAKGAKADIVILDVGNLRYAPIYDPVKSLVNAGTCDDVETVIVDGEEVVQGGKVVGVDEKSVRDRALRVAKEEWARIQELHWAGRSIEEIAPQSLKPLGK